MSVMIGMSLDSKSDGGAYCVPGAHAADAFVDALRILASSQAVVLEVVNHFVPEHARESIVKLELNATHSESLVDGPDHAAMKNEVVDHSVLGEDRKR
jgi:hypothetical protein